MGLDMYLYRRRYVKNWDHYKPEDRTKVTLTIGGKRIKLVNPSYVTEEVGYWRKANAIHKFFCDLDGGKDECQEINVERSDLRELADRCRRILLSAKTEPRKVVTGTHHSRGVTTAIVEEVGVLVDTSLAEELLPTQEGFFFGGTEYGEWYLDDLRETIKIIEALPDVANDEYDRNGGDYYYEASW